MAMVPIRLKGINLAQGLYKAKAPGSLMLMGEHAVLYGKPALVVAIDQYIMVSLKPRDDRVIQLFSALGNLDISLDFLNSLDFLENRLNLERANPSKLKRTDPSTLESLESSKMNSFKFVLTAIQSCQALLASGFDSGFELRIESEFSEKIGFGSSAAVVVATIKVLHDFMNVNLPLFQVFQQARSVVLKVQGTGSGADVAASVYGGVVYYQSDSIATLRSMEGFEGGKVGIEASKIKEAKIEKTEIAEVEETKIEKLIQIDSDFPEIYAIYSGNKVPTPKVIELVQQNRAKHALLYEQIFDAMAVCTQQARAAVLERDWIHFGQLMNIHHGLQSALSLSNNILESLVYHLRSFAGIVGAKISGAGLGDCVIGIGNAVNINNIDINIENMNTVKVVVLNHSC